MKGDVLEYLETLARETGKPETELMTMAFKVGLRQLWRERALGHYLRGKITHSRSRCHRVGEQQTARLAPR